MGIHPQGIRNSFAQKINKKQFSHIILKGDSGKKIFCIFIDQHHPCSANEPSWTLSLKSLLYKFLKLS